MPTACSCESLVGIRVSRGHGSYSHTVLGPIPSVPGSFGLGWANESAFLTSSPVMLLVQIPHLEEQWSVAKSSTVLRIDMFCRHTTVTIVGTPHLAKENVPSSGTSSMVGKLGLRVQTSDSLLLSLSSIISPTPFLCL